LQVLVRPVEVHPQGLRRTAVNDGRRSPLWVVIAAAGGRRFRTGGQRPHVDGIGTEGRRPLRRHPCELHAVEVGAPAEVKADDGDGGTVNRVVVGKLEAHHAERLEGDEGQLIARTYRIARGRAGDRRRRVDARVTERTACGRAPIHHDLDRAEIVPGVDAVQVGRAVGHLGLPRANRPTAGDGTHREVWGSAGVPVSAAGVDHRARGHPREVGVI